MAEGPLAGIRILDLTHVWAGPLATRVLADLGATVVKVESPRGRGTGDPTQLNPIGGWIGGEMPAEPWNANAVFLKLQRNKQSLAIDLKSEAGREVFLRLVGLADVVIENFSARAMPSLRLGYEELAAANPEIIYVTMPGFGTFGAYHQRVAFGPIVEAMSGLTHAMGYGPDEPRNSAMGLVDPTCATNATAAVVTALRRRQETGEGAKVELTLHEAGVSYCGPWLIEEQLQGGVERVGNRHPQMAPHGVYRCEGEDEWIALACRDDADWQALCELIDLDPGAKADLAARKAREDEIEAAIASWTCERSRAMAVAALQDAGIPAGPVNTTPDMTADPHVRARGFFVPLEAGGIPVPGNPIKMTGISSSDWTPAPVMGAHNRAVLREWLLLGESEIEALEEAGVLVDRPPE